jgi:tRNA-2-methylthio-N6-dimethylallyladenosine synthase
MVTSERNMMGVSSTLPEDTKSETGLPTYRIRTLGCQMNVHDSERMAGLLSQAGYQKSEDNQADVVVINTCAVRENADNRLYGNLGMLAAEKRRNPGMRIAVAGCLAQKDRAGIIERAPWVDVVVGTHNIDALPILLKRAEESDNSQVEIAESLQAFPSDMPVLRASAHSAWVAISVGCNNTCTFCIVPKLRGRERDRRPGEILAEIEALVSQDVREVTLLGQNVNAYGVEFGDRSAFANLLRTAGEIDGLSRLRFTSPHPRDFSAGVIAAMAETDSVMPHLHMPLQSGSDAVLKRMRRSYRSQRFLDIIRDVRTAMPRAAITTDIIVGFPGETESDFQDTLDVVAAADFSGAFTFKYSPRPGTPAAEFDDQVPADVVAARYRRLSELVEQISWRQNQALVGEVVEVLITGTGGRKDVDTRRATGRGRDNRLVHLAEPAGGVGGGDIVGATVTYAAPNHLLADADVEVISRFEEDSASCGPGTESVSGPVVLSSPAIRVGRP